MKHDYEFVRDNKLATDIVLVDGIGRTGKAMYGQIISSFERVEKMIIHIEFDYLPHLYRFNKISFDAAKAMLQISADTYLYNLMIGRGLNYRYTDATSIYKDADPTRYLYRSTLPEGQYVAGKVKKLKPIFQELTHDAIKMTDFYFDVFDKNLKILYLYRDPVPTIIEWAKRDFGDRIGNDPTELQLCYKWKKSVVPVLAYEWEEDYLKYDKMDRIVGMINYNFHSNLDAYHKVSPARKKRMQIVKFDEVIRDPWPTIEQTAKLLKTSTTALTKPILDRELCPRVIDPNQRTEQMTYILKKIKSQKYKKIFRELVEKFDTNYWQV